MQINNTDAVQILYVLCILEEHIQRWRHWCRRDVTAVAERSRSGRLEWPCVTDWGRSSSWPWQAPLGPAAGRPPGRGPAAGRRPGRVHFSRHSAMASDRPTSSQRHIAVTWPPEASRPSKANEANLPHFRPPPLYSLPVRRYVQVADITPILLVGYGLVPVFTKISPTK